MFVDAASVYDKNDKALQLRTMNLIYESVKERAARYCPERFQRRLQQHR